VEDSRLGSLSRLQRSLKNGITTTFLHKYSIETIE
jgi:hypothetical protein